jgi:hypothetical protein
MSKYIEKPITTKTLENARKVNYFNGKELGRVYYIANDKLYKKTRKDEYCEVLLQHNGGYYFYFLKNKPNGKSRINENRLGEMIYKDMNELKEIPINLNHVIENGITEDKY